MKVQVRVSPTTYITAEADNQLDLFKQLADLTEVFGEESCNKCNSPYKYRVRVVGEGKKQFTYCEAVCTNKDCRAKLAFGQSEGGALFPKRYVQKDGEHVLTEDGRKVVKGNWGWAAYNKDSGEEE